MTRRYFLDWIRIGAFALLIFYHVGMYYVTWDWHVKSPFASTAAEPFMLMSSPWRLSLLFFISGVATAFLLRKTESGFLRKRSWRLLVPLAFGMLVIVPPQAYYEVVYKLGYGDGYLAFWGRYLQADHSFCKEGDCLDLPTWNHLWFVAYLWVYTVVLCLLRWLAPKALERTGRAIVESMTSGWGLVLWPLALLAIARITLLDRFEQTHALVDDWYNHAQYLPLFLLGYVVAQAQGVWDRFVHLRWPALVLAVAGYAFLIVYFGHYTDDGTPPPIWLRNIQRGVWAMFQWTTIVAIVGFVARLQPGDSPARRYLTEAVFPIYILHQTIIVVLAYNMQPLGLHPAVEAPILIVATIALCLCGFEIARRVPLLRPLMGLQRQPAAKASPLAEATQ